MQLILTLKASQSLWNLFRPTSLTTKAFFDDHMEKIKIIFSSQTKSVIVVLFVGDMPKNMLDINSDLKFKN